MTKLSKSALIERKQKILCVLLFLFISLDATSNVFSKDRIWVSRVSSDVLPVPYFLTQSEGPAAAPEGLRPHWIPSIRQNRPTLVWSAVPGWTASVGGAGLDSGTFSGTLTGISVVPAQSCQVRNDCQNLSDDRKCLNGPSHVTSPFSLLTVLLVLLFLGKH